MAGYTDIKIVDIVDYIDDPEDPDFGKTYQELFEEYCEEEYRAGRAPESYVAGKVIAFNTHKPCWERHDSCPALAKMEEKIDEIETAAYW